MKTHLEYVLDNHFRPLSGEKKEKLTETCLSCPLFIIIYCFFGCYEEETGLAAIDVWFDSVQLLLALFSTVSPQLILPDLFQRASIRYSSLEQKKEGAARCAVFSSLSFLLPLINGGSEHLSKELDELLASCPLHRDLNSRLEKIKAEEMATGRPFSSLTLNDLELLLKNGMETSSKTEEEETGGMLLCEVVDGFISSRNALCCMGATQVLGDIFRKHGYPWKEQLDRLNDAANRFSAAACLQPARIHVASGGVYIHSNSGPVGDLHGDQFVLVRPSDSDAPEEEKEEEKEKEEEMLSKNINTKNEKL